MGRFGEPPSRFPRAKDSGHKSSSSSRHENRSSYGGSSHGADQYSSRYASNQQQSYSSLSRSHLPSLLSTDFSSNINSQPSSNGGYKYLDPNWMDSVRPLAGGSLSSCSRDYSNRGYDQSGRINSRDDYGRGSDFPGSYSSYAYNSGMATYRPGKRIEGVHDRGFREQDLLREKPRDKEEASLMKKIADLQKQLDEYEKPSSSHASSRVRSRSRSRDRIVSYNSNHSSRGRSAISTSRNRGREPVREHSDSRRPYSTSKRSTVNRPVGVARGRGEIRESRAQRPPLFREKPIQREERSRGERRLAPRTLTRNTVIRRDSVRKLKSGRSARGSAIIRPFRGSPRKPPRATGRVTLPRNRSPIRRRAREERDIVDAEVDINDLEEISDAEEERSRRSPSPRARAIRDALCSFLNERHLSEGTQHTVKNVLENMQIKEEQFKQIETTSSPSLFAVKVEIAKPASIPEYLLTELDSLLME